MTSLLAPDGRALIVAMDHARTHGHIAGLEDPGKVIDAVLDAGADGFMTSFGIIKKYRNRMLGRCSVTMRLDGGPSLFREDWLANTEWSQLHTVEEARLLGVDGVCLMLFMGIQVELQTMEIVAQVAGDCLRANMPLMVEALPGKCERIPDAMDSHAMAAACRLGFEHGADYLKTYYTGSVEGFRKVVENTPNPVLIAGGAKMNTTLDMLKVVEDAIAAGAVGVVFGRNIWQAPNPGAVVRALRAVIHEGATAAQAVEMVR
ncbi:MAG: class I fructose-bisphosphate aldolase [Caldilineaceae bacterium]